MDKTGLAEYPGGLANGDLMADPEEIEVTMALVEDEEAATQIEVIEAIEAGIRAMVVEGPDVIGIAFQAEAVEVTTATTTMNAQSLSVVGVREREVEELGVTVRTEIVGAESARCRPSRCASPRSTLGPRARATENGGRHCTHT